MTRDRWARYGAGAGAIGVGLFLASALAFGDQPALDAGGEAVAAYFEREQDAIQLGCALVAGSAPFFVWFLVTAASLGHAGGAAPSRAGGVAVGCGVLFLALFFADVAALAVGALRPANMSAEPELAAALYDLSWMLPAMAAPAGTAMLGAFALLALRDGSTWPPWLAPMGALAAAAYALRTGALFTTEGPFAADGLLGFWVPVGAILGWFLLASAVLCVNLGASPRG